VTELRFRVHDVVAEQYAAAPQLSARLGIDELSGTVVHAVALRCQVRIEPQRRLYTDAEAVGLVDLFGPRSRWSDTLRSFLWLHTTTLVPGFTGSRQVDLPLPCTYDFEVSASKYLHAVENGLVPLRFLFTGTVFTRGDNGFSVQQVPWDAEATYSMPVSVWRGVMDLHFPGAAWLRLGRDSFTALQQYRADRGLLSVDEAVRDLLARASQGVP